MITYKQYRRMPPEALAMWVADVKMHIDTGDHLTITRTIYRMSPKELEALRQQFKEIFDKRMIQLSASPWSSPVLFVRKKYGSHNEIVT